MGDTFNNGEPLPLYPPLGGLGSGMLTFGQGTSGIKVGDVVTFDMGDLAHLRFLFGDVAEAFEQQTRLVNEFLVTEVERFRAAVTQLTAEVARGIVLELFLESQRAKGSHQHRGPATGFNPQSFQARSVPAATIWAHRAAPCSKDTRINKRKQYLRTLRGA